MKIKAGIIGAAGYTGGELIRLLLNHPHAEISFAHSKSNAGKPVSHIHKDLLGDTDISFSSKFHQQVDVLFLCTGHGEARAFLSKNDFPDNIRIIDLSQDFRLKSSSTIGDKSFVYGLPELNKTSIQSAQCIANPGCFATIQLALLPLAHKKILNETYITGITGSTGAGQSLSQTSHFSWRTNNIQAYKSLTHQHISEIGESLQQTSGKAATVNFIPWRGDFARGIYISAVTECALPLDDVYELYEAFYLSSPFTHVSKEMIDLKQVVNTNKCLIHLEKEGSKLIVHAAIDNLLKGASGQAVQNMNILFGLDEKCGLTLKANLF
ncbi:MAG: N-acetyl-gamma-glutamyl-phosphate reductase [Bacteroidota bacterium]